jgi:DNA-binding transcriptional MerR regulator
MFKIGEFSKLMQVSIRMLRYYDEIGLLKPAQIDKYTGYRLYSVEQISVLQKIILLRDLKFSGLEIAAALDHWDEGFLIRQLKSKKKEIQNQISLEQQCIAKIDIAINDTKEEKIAMYYNVSFKSIPRIKILSLRKVIPNYNCEGMLWDELYRFVEREHIEITHQNNNNFAIYHDQEHKDSEVDIEVGVVVSKLGRNKDGFTFRETESVVTMACMMVYGSYENIGPAYQSFAYWLEEHKQYEMTGFSRQICHKGPYNEANPDKYLTEIQTPVQKRVS